MAAAPGICVVANSNNKGEPAFEVVLCSRSEANLHGFTPFLLCQAANIHSNKHVSMHRYRPMEGRVIASIANTGVPANTGVTIVPTKKNGPMGTGTGFTPRLGV